MESTAQLVARCIEGEQDAWDEMVGRYGRLIFHVIRSYRLSQDEREDVAQHCWLQLVQRIDTIRDTDRVGDWLATVARNEALKVQRRSQRTVPVEEPLMEAVHVDRTAGPQEHLISAELQAEVRAALSELPERCQVFLSHFLTDTPVSYDEVARRMGMRPNSVGQTRTRYLRRLRNVLVERGIGIEDRTG